MMKDPETEELVIRWMDGEMLTDDQKTHLKEIHNEDPSMRLDLDQYIEVKKALRGCMLSSQSEVPSKDLFNRTILSQIRSEVQENREEQEPSARASASHHKKSDVIVFPRWVVTTAAMAACFVFGMIVNHQFFTPKKTMAGQMVLPAQQVAPVLYSAHKGLSADVVSGKNGFTNVIVIDGLLAIPDDVDLFSIASDPIQLKPAKSPDFN